jgi:hypothetical protein
MATPTVGRSQAPANDRTIMSVAIVVPSQRMYGDDSDLSATLEMPASSPRSGGTEPTVIDGGRFGIRTTASTRVGSNCSGPQR